MLIMNWTLNPSDISSALIYFCVIVLLFTVEPLSTFNRFTRYPLWIEYADSSTKCVGIKEKLITVGISPLNPEVMFLFELLVIWGVIIPCNSDQAVGILSCLSQIDFNLQRKKWKTWVCIDFNSILTNWFLISAFGTLEYSNFILYLSVSPLSLSLVH